MTEMFGYNELLISTLKKMAVTDNPEPLLEDFLSTREFIHAAIKSCRALGKHSFQSASAVKAIADRIVGRVLSDVAFEAGVRSSDRPVRNTGELTGELKIKMPVLDEERIRVWWDRQI